MKTNTKVRKTGPMALLAFLIVAFYSCGNNSNQNDRNNQSENEEFVVEAASSNSLEIAAGGMAVTKGHSPEIRAFGQQMVDGHTAVQSEMATLAESKGWTIPTELLRKHERDLEKLRDLNGWDFDEEFIQLMIRSHEDAVDLYTDFADSDPNDRQYDQQLRAFASTKLPDLRAHLDHAKRLKDSVDRRSDSLGNRMSGENMRDSLIRPDRN